MLSPGIAFPPLLQSPRSSDLCTDPNKQTRPFSPHLLYAELNVRLSQDFINNQCKTNTFDEIYLF